MMHRNVLIGAVIILLIVAGAFVIAQRAEAPEPGSETPENTDDQRGSPEAAAAFKTQLEGRVVTWMGQPIEGFVPQMFMEVYPGLTAADFDGVDASIGHYVYADGELQHDLEGETEIHSAAQAVTKEGMITLFENVRTRLDMPPDVSAEEVIAQLDAPDDGDAGDDEPVACPADAKLCPDGSSVGRVGPDCEFAACPTTEAEVTVCTDEMKQADVCTQEYAPVCGLVEVQCADEPCEPIPETFSNGCQACIEEHVISYTEGACTAE